MTDFVPVEMTGVFDCRQFAPAGAAKPVLPEGEYNVTIVKTSIGPMKSGNGHAFTIEYKTDEGQTIEEVLSLWHTTSSQACDIAHQKLSALCHVTGVHQLNMSNHGRELVNARCVLSLGVEEQKMQTETGEKIFKQNRIKFCKSLAGQTAGELAEAVPGAAKRTVKKQMPQQQAPAQQAPAQQPQYPIEGQAYASAPQQQAPQPPQQWGAAPAQQAPQPPQQWSAPAPAAPQPPQNWGAPQPAAQPPMPSATAPWDQQK
jgi:hypothetical protein